MTDTLAPYDIAEKFWQKAHVRPVGSQIVIVPIVEERIRHKTTTGIHIDLRISHGGVDIPDSVDNAPIEGRVVALGDGMVDVIPDALVDRIALRLAGEINTYENMTDDVRVAMYRDIILAETSKRRPFRVKVGDRVMWIPWQATTIELEGTQFNLVDESAVLGWVEE
jgi:co-chaperonin GroES (HSP10)